MTNYVTMVLHGLSTDQSYAHSKKLLQIQSTASTISAIHEGDFSELQTDRSLLSPETRSTFSSNKGFQFDLLWFLFNGC